jgi:hypothetical protein
VRYEYNLFYIISISSCELPREVKGRGRARQNRRFEMRIRGSSNGRFERPGDSSFPGCLREREETRRE